MQTPRERLITRQIRTPEDIKKGYLSTCPCDELDSTAYVRKTQGKANKISVSEENRETNSSKHTWNEEEMMAEIDCYKKVFCLW